MMTWYWKVKIYFIIGNAFDLRILKFRKVENEIFAR